LDHGSKCLQAERPVGMCVRRFRLPHHVSQGDIYATHRDGVLTLRIPKSHPQLVVQAEPNHTHALG
jgi:HSP20 family molecular chaperone IbpA